MGRCCNYKKDGSPYNVYSDGLKVFTTIDSRIQQYAEEAMYNDYRNYCYSYDEKEQLEMVKNEEYEELIEDILQQLERKTIVYILSDTYLVMNF